MKVSSLFIFICFITFQESLCQASFQSGDSIATSLSSEKKFTIYLDSLEVYLYQDLEMSAMAISKCQEILDEGAEISDSVYMDFVIRKLYYHYNKLDPLGAYKVIMANESLMENKEIPKDKVRLFTYLKSFTYMSMGDLEAAQKAYYKGIELGKADKDTMTMTNNLFSLGQLFYDEEDYEGAISTYREVLAYAKTFDIAHSTHALAHFELASAHNRLEEYSAAHKMLKLAFSLAEKHKLEFIKPSIFLKMGNIFIAQNKIDSAEQVKKRMLALDQSNRDISYRENLNELRAELFRAKKMNPSALEVYVDLISELDSTSMDKLLALNTSAYEVCKDMDDHRSALNYLLVANDIKDRLDSDKKRQKIAYFKVKYDSEQKEKDNAILKAELYKNRGKSNLLYGGLFVTFLLLFGLFAAFYQKARYSKRLEETVLQRTENLRESNEKLNRSNSELDELNRILAHDLKEPLSSVIGFSELATREITNVSKTKEYLQYVTVAGQQLNQTIEDVATYRNLNSAEYKKLSKVNLKELFDDITEEMEKQYTDRAIDYSSDLPDYIISSAESLKQVFRTIFINAALYNKNKEIEIDVRYFLKDGVHNFEVADNGIGIEEKYQIQIFDMFKRLSNRATYSGTGLGLSIAKRLLENLRGEISVLRSQLDKGTTFLVSIPEEVL